MSKPLSEVLPVARRGVLSYLPLLLVALLCAPALAQNAAIEQLMRLSPAERQQLMRQYGVSEQDILNELGRGSGAAGARTRQGSAPQGPAGAGASQGSSDDSGGSQGQADRFGDGLLLDERMFEPFVPPARTADPNDLSLEGRVDYGLRFGLATFDGGRSSLQELFSIPVPDDYVVGPGDFFIVSLYGTESAQYYLQVTRDGWIDMPTLGPVSVAGLSFAEARRTIVARVAEQKIGVNASVTLDQLKSIQLTVSGEVRRPGVYVVPPLVSVVQVLSLAGGPTEIGSLREVVLNRGGELVRVDLYDYLLGGETPDILGLQTGDALHVPPVRSAAHVKGAVRRPGVYELRADESLDDLVAMAGGMSADAAPQGAVLRRYLPGGRQEIIDVELGGSRPRLALADGMILRVPRGSDFTADTIEVLGEVPGPGKREWRPGMMLSDLFADLRRDVLIARADLDFGYVVRTDPSTRHVRFHHFSLRGLTFDGEDMRLEPEDVILVLPIPGIVADEKEAMADSLAVDGEAGEELRERATAEQDGMFGTVAYRSGALQASKDRGDLLEPYMALLRAQTRDGSRVPQFTIEGEVQAPGTYPVTVDGNMSMALRAAGGLRESADADRVLVLRKPSAVHELEVFELRMPGLLAGTGAQQLEPGDVITVGRDPSLANRLQVQIDGEVASPGAYVLPAGATISDLLAIAGGVTERADLRSAVFSRSRLRAMEAQLRERYLAEIRKSLIDAQVAGDDRAAAAPNVLQLLGQLESTLEEEADGRLQVDLPRLASGDRSAEVALSSGDRLTIPAETNAVSVAGQVRVPGSFTFIPGLTASAYLELAGGLTTYSDEDSIFIVRADGSVNKLGRRSMLSFSRTDEVLYPGDRIVVPIDMTYVNRYDLARDVIAFIYQTGIGLAAVVAAFR